MRSSYLTGPGIWISSVLIFTFCQVAQSLQTPGPQTGQSVSQTARSQPPKAKKILVKALPKTTEGLVLEKGIFKLQPGYEVLPQSHNTIRLGSRGGNLSGDYTCTCSKQGGGGCSVSTVRGQLICEKSAATPCSGECLLGITINGNTTKLAIF